MMKCVDEEKEGVEMRKMGTSLSRTSFVEAVKRLGAYHKEDVLLSAIGHTYNLMQRTGRLQASLRCYSIRII